MFRVLFVFACVIAAGLANPATQEDCPNEVTKCAVSNVDITPCAKKERCVFKHGKHAAISFDFTPEFNAAALEHNVTAVVLNTVQEFAGLNKNACSFTSCPAEAGKKQTFTYDLHLSKKNTAKGKWDITWTLWNKDDPSQKCCFVTFIQIKP